MYFLSHILDFGVGLAPHGILPGGARCNIEPVLVASDTDDDEAVGLASPPLSLLVIAHFLCHLRATQRPVRAEVLIQEGNVELSTQQELEGSFAALGLGELWLVGQHTRQRLDQQLAIELDIIRHESAQATRQRQKRASCLLRR
eukprot:449698-Prymnesium_polylepis.1